jgi:hypothetical protein
VLTDHVQRQLEINRSQEIAQKVRDILHSYAMDKTKSTNSNRFSKTRRSSQDWRQFPK